MKKLFLNTLSLFLILSISLFLSCKKNSNNKGNEASEKVYDLNITAKEENLASMSELKKTVFNNLINKKPIKFKDLTTLLIEEQVNYYNKDSKSSTTNATTSWIESISSVNSKTSNIEDIKVLYQNEKLKMSEIKYNKIATSIPYIMNEKRLQCFSSTMLHQLVLRKHSKFQNMNPVAIYERGHILSGYMKKDGNSWKLIGIENTVKGKGIKEYKDLTNYTGINIRVVDSELFAILEIFKNDIKNVNDVAKQVLDLTAKKYDIDPKFNYNYSNILTESIVTPFVSNNSLLSFGSKNVPDGDQDISEADYLSSDVSSSVIFEPNGGIGKIILTNVTENEKELLEGVVYLVGSYRYPPKSDIDIWTFQKNNILKTELNVYDFKLSNTYKITQVTPISTTTNDSKYRIIGDRTSCTITLLNDQLVEEANSTGFKKLSGLENIRNWVKGEPKNVMDSEYGRKKLDYILSFTSKEIFVANDNTWLTYLKP